MYMLLLAFKSISEILQVEQLHWSIFLLLGAENSVHLPATGMSSPSLPKLIRKIAYLKMREIADGQSKSEKVSFQRKFRFIKNRKKQ